MKRTLFEMSTGPQLMEFFNNEKKRLDNYYQNNGDKILDQALTKVYPPNEPVFFNKFDINNDKDCNSFTTGNYGNSKQIENKNTKYIIAKISLVDKDGYNYGLVNEDRYIGSVEDQRQNGSLIQKKYPSNIYDFTGTLIVPFGESIKFGLEKLEKNTLSKMMTRFNCLIFSSQYDQQDYHENIVKYTNGIFTYKTNINHIHYNKNLMDNKDPNQFNYLIKYLVDNQLKLKSINFTHLGKYEYHQWNNFFMDGLKNLGKRKDNERTLLDKCINYDDYSLKNKLFNLIDKDMKIKDLPRYSAKEILSLVSYAFENIEDLTDVILRFIIDKDDFDREMCHFRKYVPNEQLKVYYRKPYEYIFQRN